MKCAPQVFNLTVRGVFYEYTLERRNCGGCIFTWANVRGVDWALDPWPHSNVTPKRVADAIEERFAAAQQLAGVGGAS